MGLARSKLTGFLTADERRSTQMGKRWSHKICVDLRPSAVELFISSLSFSITKDDIALARMIDQAKRPEKIYRATVTTFLSITQGAFNSSGASYRPSPPLLPRLNALSEADRWVQTFIALVWYLIGLARRI